MEERQVASNKDSTPANSQYRNLDLSFNLKNTEIDYFHIDTEVLSMGELRVTEENVNLQGGEYLDLQRHFQSLDDTVQETVVLNIPVGHGKTTLCYKLIKKYYEEDYNIIVCSPFQKLVEKDHAALTREIPNAIIFNYKELDFDTDSFGGSFVQHLAEEGARIHIMTINCLLKNPGEDRYEQAFHKSRFLQRLKNSIRNRGGKVVFFFDEIHESVVNFKNEFIPNLAYWRDITHKCFISSATFTSASIPVIRYISYLTIGTIKVFYTSRRKAERQANLHLHITSSPYSSGNLFPLGKIPQIINSTVNAGGKVNILCAYRSIVNSLVNSRTENPIARSVVSLNPNICTSDTDNEFDPNSNNIGTNFKTGVNIEDGNTAFIVIMPIVNKSNPFNSYGIFSDGIPAIIQSLARVRNGGNIHVFMYEPETILDLEGHSNNIPIELYQDRPSTPYKRVNESYNLMRQKYDSKKSFVQHDINFLTEILNEFEELKYHYPTFQEVLIEKSQSYLLSKHEWMGKHISPYLLWAAINNQFCNATLQCITYQTKSYRTVNLTSGNMKDELIATISDEVLGRLKREPIRRGIEILIEELGRSMMRIEGDENMHHVTNAFVLNGKAIPYSKLRADRAFNFALLGILLSAKEAGQNIDKGIYIRTCIMNSRSYSEENTSTPRIVRLYRIFDSYKQTFIELISTKLVSHKDRLLLPPNYDLTMPDDLVKGVIELIYPLKETDSLLNAFTFFHNHKNTLSPNSITPAMKKSVIKELESLFLNASENRILYNGAKHYIISQPINNQIIITNISFLE